MLVELAIADLAIIEKLTLSLGAGLTALTGETGAGKSIILGALNLLLGDRACAEDLRAGADEAEVSARFEIGEESPALALLGAEGLADADEPNVAIVRRVIARTGRSRCWVNGKPVAVGTLRRLGDLLVDLHGQHQHQSLLDPERHRWVLDGFGGHGPELRAVRDAHAAWANVRDALRRLEGDSRELERRREFLLHQIREIEAAGLCEGELDNLEAERRRLRHAESLLEAAALGSDRLHESDEISAVALLGEVRRALETVAEHDDALAALIPRLADAEATVLDVAETLRSYRERVEADPGRLDEIEERIDAIRRLLRRHADTEAELLALAERWRAEAAAIENRDEELARLESEKKRLATDLASSAIALSDARRSAAQRLGRALVRELRDVAMERVKFDVRFEVIPDESGPEVGEHGRIRVDATGMDRVEFLISPNPGEPLRPLAKIASGGELSRLMLALKAVAAGKGGVPTLVFDEIDVGISGQTASRVAEKMAKLARRHQILCITHLPQIAAVADRHLGVTKRTRGRRTVTEVTALEGDARVEALATLIGGDRRGDAALQHARELLGA